MKKICTKCGIEKDIEKFWKDKRIKSWIVAQCRECLNKVCVAYNNRNREKVREANRRSKEKHKDKVLEREKIYRENNREILRERQRIFKEKNPERKKEIALKHFYKKKDKYKKYAQEYRKKFSEKVNARTAKKRALKKKQTPSWVKSYHTHHFYKLSIVLEDIFWYKFHVDHIIPLAQWWLHSPFNLQVIPATINFQKSDKLNFSYTI